SRGYAGDFKEGLNHRRDTCPADYTYDASMALAYLATADRRFVDYFEEAGVNVVTRFVLPPPVVADQYLEVAMDRLSHQRLELLANGAEFGRDPSVAPYLLSALVVYVDSMLMRVLVDGHSCAMGG